MSLDGARIATVVLCACAVSFFLRVLAGLINDALILRRAKKREEFIAVKMRGSAPRRRERLTVIDSGTLQWRFRVRIGARRP